MSKRLELSSVLKDIDDLIAYEDMNNFVYEALYKIQRKIDILVRKNKEKEIKNFKSGKDAIYYLKGQDIRENDIDSIDKAIRLDRVLDNSHKKGEEINLKSGLSVFDIEARMPNSVYNPYLTELNELRKENALQKEVISELSKEKKECSLRCIELEEQKDELDSQNTSLIQSNGKLCSENRDLKFALEISNKEIESKVKERLSKNNPQYNNTRLQGLIDEVFDLLNELDKYGYDDEIKNKIDIRLKIINTLK